jgi:hypothetical protein
MGEAAEETVRRTGLGVCGGAADSPRGAQSPGQRGELGGRPLLGGATDWVRVARRSAKAAQVPEARGRERDERPQPAADAEAAGAASPRLGFTFTTSRARLCGCACAPVPACGSSKKYWACAPGHGLSGHRPGSTPAGACNG